MHAPRAERTSRASAGEHTTTRGQAPQGAHTNEHTTPQTRAQPSRSQRTGTSPGLVDPGLQAAGRGVEVDVDGRAVVDRVVQFLRHRETHGAAPRVEARFMAREGAGCGKHRPLRISSTRRSAARREQRQHAGARRREQRAHRAPSCRCPAWCKAAGRSRRSTANDKDTATRQHKLDARQQQRRTRAVRQHSPGATWRSTTRGSR